MLYSCLNFRQNHLLKRKTDYKLQYAKLLSFFETLFVLCVEKLLGIFSLIADWGQSSVKISVLLAISVSSYRQQN